MLTMGSSMRKCPQCGSQANQMHASCGFVDYTCLHVSACSVSHRPTQIRYQTVSLQQGPIPVAAPLPQDGTGYTYPCSMQSLMPSNRSAQGHNPMRPGYGVVAGNPPFFPQSLEKPQQHTDMCMVVPYHDLGKVDSATTVQGLYSRKHLIYYYQTLTCYF